MSIKNKRPGMPRESLLSRRSLLAPDFSTVSSYLNTLKPDSVNNAKTIGAGFSGQLAAPVDHPWIETYNGYVEQNYMQFDYAENTF